MRERVERIKRKRNTENIEINTSNKVVQGNYIGTDATGTLDFVPTDELRKEAVIPATEEEYRGISSRLDRLVEAGREKGLSVHYHLISPEKRREVCTENVQRALCISSDGTVTPCMYTNLRVSGTYYDLQGKKVSCERMVFGNIHEKNVKDIWKEKSYRNFRRSFRRGALAPTCQKCPKIW